MQPDVPSRKEVLKVNIMPIYILTAINVGLMVISPLRDIVIIRQK
jgi:hypothetical protein